MTTTTTAPAPFRMFGKCPVKGCTHRAVISQDVINWGSEKRCPEHGRMNKWSYMTAKVNTKECADRCMASTGPSCSCSCGGENHGVNHL